MIVRNPELELIKIEAHGRRETIMRVFVGGQDSRHAYEAKTRRILLNLKLKRGKK